MTITVDRKDITLRQRTIDESTLTGQYVMPTPGAWEAQFAGRLSTGEWVETAEYVRPCPEDALQAIETALMRAGWKIVD